jgi:hypothetical protein
MGLSSHQDRQTKLNHAGVYARHCPETTLLYQIIQEYWPEFQAKLMKTHQVICSEAQLISALL